MKSTFRNVTASVALTLLVSGCGYHVPSQGWVTVIDGEKGMDNFFVSGSKANWRAAEGAIQCDKTEKGVSNLATKLPYKDFELYVEFWADHDTNSGVYLRAPNTTNISTSTGAYEVQIWDKNPNPAQSTGAILPSATVQPIYKAGGRWNTYEIYARGSQITAKLNGVVTAVSNDSKSLEGRIAIQCNAGPIKVRKLLVKDLELSHIRF